MSLANTANMDTILMLIKNVNKFKFQIVYSKTLMENVQCVNREYLLTIMSAVDRKNAQKKTVNTVYLLIIKRHAYRVRMDTIYFKQDQRI